MPADTNTDTDYRLLLTLDARSLPVSYVSSTLRVLQAAVREVARGVEDGRSMFDGQPQPVLLLDATMSEGSDLYFNLYFADPADDAPMAELSHRAFAPFMQEFGRVLKGMPQRGLWGRMARTSGHRRFRSEAARRLDELRVELRHFRKAVLKHGGRRITFDGDQMEIE